ncbi:unnamed protein product [Onchocerca ochengi]|uniref:RNAse P Rpr2/Rpp21 subunit domain-containing protein n=1 Tax=Onchocerca ochengi TaxID=42157 RepID=A0A182DYT3_ONCOC|nr:unnamed protein product [Onchocerca ochengi]
MEEGSEVFETDTKYEQYTYRTIRYCQKYAKKCIKLGIPAPFAAEMTRNASQTLKNLGLKDKKELCHCFRCNLDLTSTKTVSFRLSVPKKKVKKSKWKRQRRPAQLIAVCKGCGAEMKGGILATLEYEKQRMRISSDQILRRGTGRSSKQIVEKKISSSGRRRKSTSKLQRILASQTPIRKEPSLQDFLEIFKIST